MSDKKDIIKAEDAELTARPVTQDGAPLSEAELEDVSGGFLDAHGDVSIVLRTMPTITTGGTKN